MPPTLKTIRHFRSESGTEAELRPAIVFGIGTGDSPVSYWPIFFLFPVTLPEVFAKVNSSQIPSRFWNGEWKRFHPLLPNFPTGPSFWAVYHLII